jgi:hypothetical protein
MAHGAANTEFSLFTNVSLSFCGNISLIASSNSVISPIEYDVAPFDRPQSVFFGVSSYCSLKIGDSCSLSSFAIFTIVCGYCGLLELAF